MCNLVSRLLRNEATDFQIRVADALPCIGAIDWRRVFNYRLSPDLTCIRHHAFRPLIPHMHRCPLRVS